MITTYDVIPARTIIADLAAVGIAATCHNTGGGCATIFTDGDLVIGPGAYTSDGPVFYTDELFVGPETDEAVAAEDRAEIVGAVLGFLRPDHDPQVSGTCDLCGQPVTDGECGGEGEGVCSGIVMLTSVAMR